MNDMTERLPGGQDGMAAVAAHELTTVAGGTEYGDGGCATMWPRDPRTGLPTPPTPKGKWFFSLNSFGQPA